MYRGQLLPRVSLLLLLGLLRAGGRVPTDARRPRLHATRRHRPHHGRCVVVHSFITLGSKHVYMSNSATGPDGGCVACMSVYECCGFVGRREHFLRRVERDVINPAARHVTFAGAHG